MPVARYYEVAARQLADEVGEGFKSKHTDALRYALREASDANVSLTGPARRNLETALRRERVHVYPPLTDMSCGTYRLYHRDSMVAFLVDAITDPGESADETLMDILEREEVVMIFRRERGVS